MDARGEGEGEKKRSNRAKHASWHDLNTYPATSREEEDGYKVSDYRLENI